MKYETVMIALHESHLILDMVATVGMLLHKQLKSSEFPPPQPCLSHFLILSSSNEDILEKSQCKVLHHHALIFSALLLLEIPVTVNKKDPIK